MKLFLIFVACIALFPAFAQDKMLPQSPPASPQPRAWDIRYLDLEPQLELQLADAPNSLEIMDELARVYRALGKYDKAAELYRNALRLRESAAGKLSIGPSR